MKTETMARKSLKAHFFLWGALLSTMMACNVRGADDGAFANCVNRCMENGWHDCWRRCRQNVNFSAVRLPPPAESSDSEDD
jgi:hypothetical protein